MRRSLTHGLCSCNGLFPASDHSLYDGAWHIQTASPPYVAHLPTSMPPPPQKKNRHCYESCVAMNVLARPHLVATFVPFRWVRERNASTSTALLVWAEGVWDLGIVAMDSVCWLSTVVLRTIPTCVVSGRRAKDRALVSSNFVRECALFFFSASVQVGRPRG